MKRMNFSYSALVLVVTGFAITFTGCGQKQELDPRTQPELVRIVEIGSSSGADPAFTGVVSARVQSNLGFRVPGKITKRLVDTGQSVRAGQPLMTIDRTDYVHAITARTETVSAAKAKAGQTVVKLAHSGPREAAVNLPETLRPALGSTAYATLYGSMTRIPVRLRQLSGAADLQTRTFEARYVLAGAAANAPLGATVTVHLSGDAGTDMLQVPVASVLDQGKGPGIWLLNPSTSTVSFQPVQVRQLGEDLATISGNLHPGQQVVALGVHLLRDGERVRVENKAEIQ